MKERVVNTPYGLTCTMRYTNGWFWVDRGLRFENSRVKRRRPIRGIGLKKILRRVVLSFDARPDQESK